MGAYKNLYIVDTSVIVKWLFQDEVDSVSAIEVKRDYLNKDIQLAIPNLAFFEVLNVVSLKSKNLATQFFSQLLLFEIDEYHLNLSLVSKAVEIVEKYSGVSFYDAIYHALALKLGGTFLTADEKYFHKVKNLRNIKLLKNYKS